MPKIGNPKSNKDSPCERCNSKRKIGKKWTEKVKNMAGFMVIEHVQIICTNKECQMEFERKLVEEEVKREKLKELRNSSSGRPAAVK